MSVNLLRPIITIRIKYDTFTRTALAALAFCFGGCLYFTGHHWHADDAGAVCAAAGERYGVVDCGSEPGDCGNAADVGRVAAFVGRAVRPLRRVARAVDGVADAGGRLAAGVVHAHAVRLVGGHGAAGGLGLLVAWGMGAGSWSILMSLIANRLPERMRGLASGVANAGGSFGQFVFAPMLQWLMSLPQLGWRGAMWVLAAWAVLILPAARWLSHGTHKVQAVSHAPHTHEPMAHVVRQAFRNRNYILLHLGFATCGFHVAFLATHLPNEIALCGLPVSVASTSLAIVGIANLVGSLVVGWCVGRWRNKSILAVLYAVRVVLITAYLFMPRTDVNFYIFAAGLGLTWLATVPPTAALTGRLFGTRYLATLFGLTLLSHQIGGFLGAYLGGKAIMAFNDYGWMWHADLVLAALAVVLHLMIREPNIQTPAS